MSDNLIKISASSVKTYDQCPKKYWFNYIDHAPKKEWDHLVLGNFCHKTLELFHQEYLTNKVPKASFGKLMKTCFDQAALEFEGLTAAIKEEAFELVKDYLVVLKASPMPDVRGVEIPFEFELGDGIVIRGFIDRIDNTPSGVKIVDYKTTKNAKYLDPFQLSIYGLWLRKEDPALKEFDGCYVLLRHKSTTKDYKFNARDLDRTHKELMTYANRIKSETVWSTSPSPLCKYCDFKDLCENEKAW